jgi:hypothetical protein
LSHFHRVFRQRFGHSPGSRRWQNEASRPEGWLQGDDVAAHPTPKSSSIAGDG